MWPDGVFRVVQDFITECRHDSFGQFVDCFGAGPGFQAEEPGEHLTPVRRGQHRFDLVDVVERGLGDGGVHACGAHRVRQHLIQRGPARVGEFADPGGVRRLDPRPQRGRVDRFPGDVGRVTGGFAVRRGHGHQRACHRKGLRAQQPVYGFTGRQALHPLGRVRGGGPVDHTPTDRVRRQCDQRGLGLLHHHHQRLRGRCEFDIGQVRRHLAKPPHRRQRVGRGSSALGCLTGV